VQESCRRSPLGDEATITALRGFDRLYPQPNDESALMQLQIQLAEPLPYDLQDMRLDEYKNLPVRWHDWNAVKLSALHYSTLIFDRVIGATP